MLVWFLWRRRTFFCWVTPIVMWLLAEPVLPGYVAGLVLLVAGHAIRIWAAGYLHKLTELITDGPFAHTRNPLYIGSFFLMCGYCLMAWRLELAVVVIILFIIFHGGAVIYEERLLQAKFGQAYTDYCKRVPMIVPRWRMHYGDKRFSWPLVFHNREQRSIAGSLLLAILFGISLAFPDIAPLRWLGVVR